MHLCSPQNRIEEVKSKQKKETNINLKSRQRGMWGISPWANGTERIATERK